MPSAGSLASGTFLAYWMVGTSRFSHSLHCWGATEEDSHSIPSDQRHALRREAQAPPANQLSHRRKIPMRTPCTHSLDSEARNMSLTPWTRVLATCRKGFLVSSQSDASLRLNQQACVEEALGEHARCRTRGAAAQLCNLHLPLTS